MGAMYRARTANDNTAVGHYALLLLDYGNYNVALGKSAMQNGPVGQGSCTAVGYRAMLNHLGNSNTAVGRSALENANNVTEVVALGAFTQSAFNNCILLGNGATATQQMELCLGGAGISSTNLFVTTTTPPVIVPEYLRVSVNGVRRTIRLYGAL